MNILFKKVLLAVLFVLSFALPSWAAVNFSIEPLAKNYKASSIVSLKVSVTNDGDAPFTGEVVLRLSNQYRQVPQYTIKINALNNTKTWVLKIPQDYLQGKVVANLEQDGRVLQKRITNYYILHELPAISTLYLVPEGNNVPQFLISNINDQANNFRQYTELIKAKETKTYDFFAYDLIVLQDINNLKLKDSQWAELIRWVESGRSLIIPGGDMSLLPQQLSAVESKGSKKYMFLPQLEREMGINLPRGSELTVQSLIPKKDAQIVYSADGLNWIIKKRYGQGSIVFLPVAFSDSTFISWQGSGVLWQRIIRNISSETSAFGFENYTGMGEFSWILSGLLPTQMPAISILVAIFIIYVLLVGFGSYLFLKKNDRRGLMWISVPLFALAFYVATYYFGASKRSTEVLVAQSGTITLYDSYSQIDSGIGIFVPKQGDYHLTIPGDFAVPAYYEANKNSSVELVENEITTTFKNMPVWSMQSIQTSLQRPAKGNFRIENIKKSNNKTSMTITNTTNFDLEDCFIGREGTVYYYLKKLNKGKKIDITFDLDKPRSIYEFLSAEENLDAKRRQLVNMEINLIENALHSFKGIPQSGWMIGGLTKEGKLAVKVNNAQPKNIITLFLIRQNLTDLGSTQGTGRPVKYSD